MGDAVSIIAAAAPLVIPILLISLAHKFMRRTEKTGGDWVITGNPFAFRISYTSRSSAKPDGVEPPAATRPEVEAAEKPPTDPPHAANPPGGGGGME